jgi:hypothetical protein
MRAMKPNLFIRLAISKMPLTELMHYFNDQLQVQARTKALPKTGFFKADNQYWGRFGNLILGSRFQDIKSFADDAVIGYNSELLVRSAAGNALDIDSIFNSLDSTDQIVHLDRLVRTLHSLNYLQQYDGRKDLLSLQVQPRHIIGVDSDHGKTFEKILSDCGLGPERVLLHTRLLDEQSLPHFLRALHSYHERGYKIGIHLHSEHDIALLTKLGISPDVNLVSHPSVSEWLVKHPPPLTLNESQRILVIDATVKNDGKLIEKEIQAQANGYLLHNSTDTLNPALNSNKLDEFPLSDLHVGQYQTKAS